MQIVDNLGWFSFSYIKNSILCVLIRIDEAILMKTHNIPSSLRKSKRYPYYASRPGAMINTHKLELPHNLELPLSRTYYHGFKGITAI